MSACLDIAAVGVHAGQIFLYQAHAFNCDSLAHRVVVRRTISFQTMRERIHAGAGGDHGWHTDGQLGVTDNHRSQKLRVKNDFLFVSFGVR